MNIVVWLKVNALGRQKQATWIRDQRTDLLDGVIHYDTLLEIAQPERIEFQAVVSTKDDRGNLQFGM